MEEESVAGFIVDFSEAEMHPREIAGSLDESDLVALAIELATDRRVIKVLEEKKQILELIKR